MKIRNILYYMIASDVIFIDQITKAVASYYADNGIVVTSFLSFEYLINRGISWGFLQALPTENGYFILVTALIVLLTLGVAWYAVRRFQEEHAIYGEILVISGSVSNLIDRALLLGVRDFLMFHWGPYEWPVFNVADIAIVLGVIIMCIQQVQES